MCNDLVYMVCVLEDKSSQILIMYISLNSWLAKTKVVHVYQPTKHRTQDLSMYIHVRV